MPPRFVSFLGLGDGEMPRFDIMQRGTGPDRDLRFMPFSSAGNIRLLLSHLCAKLQKYIEQRAGESAPPDLFAPRRNLLDVN